MVNILRSGDQDSSIERLAYGKTLSLRPCLDPCILGKTGVIFNGPFEVMLKLQRERVFLPGSGNPNYIPNGPLKVTANVVVSLNF
jgi:hypothetical protein